MEGIALDSVVRKPKRTILVCWRDRNGVSRSAWKVVRFEKGLGPYVHWNKRAIPVDATQTRLDVPMPGLARDG